jgi:hypothetical protein
MSECYFELGIIMTDFHLRTAVTISFIKWQYEDDYELWDESDVAEMEMLYFKAPIYINWLGRSTSNICDDICFQFQFEEISCWTWSDTIC